MIRGIPNLFVNIESLAIHDHHNLHFPNILEEIPETRREALIGPIIHRNPNLIKTDQRMRLWLKLGKRSHRNDPDTRYLDVSHICIDIPTFLQITMHLPNHKTRLSSTLFTKNKGKFIRIPVFIIEKYQNSDQDKNETDNHQKF